MQGLQVFIRTVDALNEWLGRLIAWLTLGCVLATFGVAVMRYQFSIGRPWAEELYVWLHAFVFMAGAGYTFVQHGHVRVDIFYGSMSLRRRAWIDLLGTLFFILGVIGILIPVMPQVVFFVLSLVFFSMAFPSLRRRLRRFRRRHPKLDRAFTKWRERGRKKRLALIRKAKKLRHEFEERFDETAGRRSRR